MVSELDLSNNYLDDDGVLDLAEMLKSNCTLRTLNLNDNYKRSWGRPYFIADKAIVKFREALEQQVPAIPQSPIPRLPFTTAISFPYYVNSQLIH